MGLREFVVLFGPFAVAVIPADLPAVYGIAVGLDILDILVVFSMYVIIYKSCKADNTLQA